MDTLQSRAPTSCFSFDVTWLKMTTISPQPKCQMLTSKKYKAKRGDQMSNYDVKKRTGKKGRPLEETARWLIVAFPSSLNSQSFSTDFDEIGWQRVNEIFVRALFRLTCKIILAQKIATFSRENQTQFKIIGAIWWHLKKSEEMKLIKTSTTAVLFKQSAHLSQHEDWKSTKRDCSAIFCKTISHRLY